MTFFTGSSFALEVARLKLRTVTTDRPDVYPKVTSEQARAMGKDGSQVEPNAAESFTSGEFRK